MLRPNAARDHPIGTPSASYSLNDQTSQAASPGLPGHTPYPVPLTRHRRPAASPGLLASSLLLLATPAARSFSPPRSGHSKFPQHLAHLRHAGAIPARLVLFDQFGDQRDAGRTVG